MLPLKRQRWKWNFVIFLCLHGDWQLLGPASRNRWTLSCRHGGIWGLHSWTLCHSERWNDSRELKSIRMRVSHSSPYAREELEPTGHWHPQEQRGTDIVNSIEVKDSEPVCYPAKMLNVRLNPGEAGSYLASRSSASLLYVVPDSFSQARSLVCSRASSYTSMLEFLIVLNYCQTQVLAIANPSEITDKRMYPCLTNNSILSEA